MRKNKLKKFSIVFVAGMVMVLTLGATISNVTSKHKEQGNITAAEEKEPEQEKEVFYVGTNEEGQKYTYDAKKVAQKLESYDYSNDGKKIVFLTFDDGTSKTNTPEVLRILRENNVKATFFLTGSNIDNGGQTARDLIKQEFEEGHAIANHSYSHDIKTLYPGRSLDLEAFKADFEKNDKLLKEVL